VRRFELDLLARSLFGENASVREIRKDRHVQVCVFESASATQPRLASEPVPLMRRREAYVDLMGQMESV